MWYIYYALVSLTTVNSIVLPTIYWDPRNPIFSCEVTIRARLYDTLTLACPTGDLPYQNLLLDNNQLKENAYFLGTNERKFNECDATGSNRLLYCSYTKDEKPIYPFFFKKDSGDSAVLSFEPGKTHYIIGTGFRDAKNLDQLINGSCNTVEGGDVKRYHLRLKIYICTNEEIISNKCGECRYAGCYFKNCENCSEWKIDRNVEQKTNTSRLCFLLESQTCSNPFLSSNDERRYRLVNVSCSTPTPTTAPLIESTSVSSLHYNTTSVFTEPTVVAVQKPPAENAGTTTYVVLVVSSLVALVIGIGIGALGFKKIHKKKCNAVDSFNKICYEKKTAQKSDQCFVSCNATAS
ncbi:uncharacterized protein LOC105847084 isoform X1 [Hydra vulgaris]|uniref:uncharacterized protein LOC105847084 isoform X1 n=1 Tax=Hydra vulgaris TaxID=6087 RepID=UPI001F5E590A|nr:uncharacterized protein LOC105847084 isoform X1 [Hydra vulgaris]